MLRAARGDLNYKMDSRIALMPGVAGAAIPSVPASASFSFQLRGAGYSSVGASTVIQTMTLFHMPVANMIAHVRCFAVHGFAIVGMRGVNISR